MSPKPAEEKEKPAEATVETRAQKTPKRKQNWQTVQDTTPKPPKLARQNGSVPGEPEKQTGNTRGRSSSKSSHKAKRGGKKS